MRSRSGLALMQLNGMTWLSGKCQALLQQANLIGWTVSGILISLGWLSLGVSEVGCRHMVQVKLVNVLWGGIYGLTHNAER